MAEKANGWGGRREGAGRKPGSSNRATKEQKRTLSAMARDHTEIALAALAEVAAFGSTDSARVAAAVAILDRGYGRPAPLKESDQRQKSIIDEIREINERVTIQQAPINLGKYAKKPSTG
jgi:hypothetical protein